MKHWLEFEIHRINVADVRFESSYVLVPPLWTFIITLVNTAVERTYWLEAASGGRVGSPD